MEGGPRGKVLINADHITSINIECSMPIVHMCPIIAKHGFTIEYFRNNRFVHVTGVTKMKLIFARIQKHVLLDS